MKSQTSFLFAAVLIVLSQQALAQNDVRLGNPAYAGTGCRPGTVDAVLSPGAQQLSILFSDYVALAGRSNRVLFCGVAGSNFSKKFSRTHG